MILDTFLFAGELDLLQIRVRELEGVVDRHVAIMGDRTFQGEAQRPLVWWGNVEVVTVPCEGDTPFQREERQRAYVDYLAGRFGGDLFLHGDVDEVPRAEDLAETADHLGIGRLPRDRVRLRGDLHQLAIDWWLPEHGDRADHPFAGPVVATGAQIAAAGGASAMRRDLSIPERLHSGWHLQWVMTPTECVRKVRSFAHPEFNREPYTLEWFWQACRATGADPLERWSLVHRPIGDASPRAVREDPERWAHLLARPVQVGHPR